MNVAGRPYRTIWVAPDRAAVEIIDQTRLPHDFVIARLATIADAVHAIKDMQVRGAPLIGATAAYGLWLALRTDPSDAALESASALLKSTRPTAVNLRWAVDKVRAAVAPLAPNRRATAAFDLAAEICEADIATNRAIGQHGLELIKTLVGSVSCTDRNPRRLVQDTSPTIGRSPINVLTHCNAGWLATVDVGTATAPIYAAHAAGIPIHVWVDETRPRNQGASLTAWELLNEGIPHTIIADNAGGHLMQQGRVDLVIVGTDRTAANGDVANKIGTYLKALAAHDNRIPFYVALPSSSIDWTIPDGSHIPIEERSPDEVKFMVGQSGGRAVRLSLTPEGSPAANPAFDVTPARLITGLITERGNCVPTALRSLFPLDRPTA